MTKIPRKKVNGLLKQAGFSGEEICGGISLLSVNPIPVLMIEQETWEIAKMWSDIFNGKEPSVKEVSTAYYQCLLLGEAIGVKIITTEPDLKNPGEWKKESKIEVAVYRKISREKWEKITIIQRKDKQPDTISNSEQNRIIKVAKFMELVVFKEMKRNCRIQFFGA